MAPYRGKAREEPITLVVRNQAVNALCHMQKL